MRPHMIHVHVTAIESEYYLISVFGGHFLVIQRSSNHYLSVAHYAITIRFCFTQGLSYIPNQGQCLSRMKFYLISEIHQETQSS